jgi:hypothetical protein
MVRCQAFCNSGLRCKKSAPNDIGFCYTHNPDNIVYCCNCKLVVPNNKLCNLNNCDHKFCIECIATNIYYYQWFDDFSTDHPLRCPECDIKLSDNNWESVMDYLVVKKQFLNRKIIKTAYLSKYQHNILLDIIKLNQEYDYQTDDHRVLNIVMRNHKDVTFDEIPSKVYFVKNKQHRYQYYYNNDTTHYTFEIDYILLKKENEQFNKNLIEYFFHPKRIKRLGGIEWLESN